MPRSVPLLLALLLALAAPAAAQAPPPMLESPLRCVNGQDCIIRQYVDHDPGPGFKDYTCGRLSYDGHTGTDIQPLVPDAVRAGVEVLAAAPGTVLAVRDGMDDVSSRQADPADLKQRGGGNLVLLDHGGGWRTSYGHLRKGSVKVTQGQQVKAGQVLGLLGLSGRSEFPHVELVVFKDGRPVDPFRGLAAGPPCGLGDAPLWSPEALSRLAYAPLALIGAGWAGEKPDMIAVHAGAPGDSRLSVLTQALFFWVEFLGAKPGDEILLRMTAPDGTILAEHRATLDQPKTNSFLYIGKPRRVAPWPVGTYAGEFRLARGNGSGKRTTVLETVRILEIR